MNCVIIDFGRINIVVRFLALVTTMVTMVDHGNHRSNDRSNHRGYYDRYYNSAFPSFSYYDGNQGC